MSEYAGYRATSSVLPLYRYIITFGELAARRSSIFYKAKEHWHSRVSTPNSANSRKLDPGTSNF